MCSHPRVGSGGCKVSPCQMPYAAAWAAGCASPSAVSWRGRYSCGPTPPCCHEAVPQGSRCVGCLSVGAALGGDGAGSLGGALTARIPIPADCLSRFCLAKLLLIMLRHRRAQELADPASAPAVSSCPGCVHFVTVCAERRRRLWLVCISEHSCRRRAKLDG